MIKLQNITKDFGDRTILKNVTLDINQGDFIMVMGANGAGKTTLLKIISGMQKPDQGSIFFKENNVTHEDRYVRASWLSKLAQNPAGNVINSMTVEENLALAVLAYNPQNPFSFALNCMHDEIYQQIEKEYHLDLRPLKKTCMSQLSGGQRQLIAFIMMTLSKPSLLLLDEPTAALDTQATTKLLTTVVRFVKEHAMTALMITHDPEMAHFLGNKLWIVKDQHVLSYNEHEKKSVDKEALLGTIEYAKILSN